MTVEDLRNDPSRRPNPLAVSWSTGLGYEGQNAQGVTKHFQTGGPEDEAGRVDVNFQPGANGGRYNFTAMHYNPSERGTGDAWRDKTGDFVVKSQNRAMIAGESLLRRLQTGSE